MRQLVYTMFFIDNHDLFHFSGKENLVKHQKVSKCYGQDCLKNITLFFMSLLRAAIFKTNHFFVEIYFIFLKKRLNSNLKGFQNQI